MSRLSRSIALSALAAIWLGSAALASAGDPAALVRETEQAYREAEKALFAGDLDTARQKVEAASKLLAEARAAGAPETRLATIENRTRQLSDKIARRSAPASAPAAAASSAPAAAAPAAAGAKLPAGVSYRLREAERLLQRGERAVSEASATLSVEWRVGSARASAKEVRDKLDEIAAQFAGQYAADDKDLQAIEARVAAVEQAATAIEAGENQRVTAAAAAAEQAAGASAPWVARLQPYAVGLGQRGHDPQKYLVPSATMETAEMNRRTQVYGEVKAALAELAAAGIEERTEELDEIVRTLETNAAEFETSVREYAQQSLQEAGRKLNEVSSFLSEQSAKADRNETFVLLDKDQLTEIGDLLDWAAGLSKPGDPAVTAARDRLGKAAEQDAALRKRRVADTRMRPDAFRGPDLAAIRDTAVAVAQRERPGTTVVRTTVPGADWVQESVIEYTDTTGTALRHRTTRSVTAQVAVKGADGARLLTLDISSDLQAGGQWGPLKGHVMYSDAILPENIAK